MTVVFVLTFTLLAVAGLAALVRMLRGPRSLDRLLALDVVLVLIVAGAATDMARTGRGLNLALLVAVALLNFVASVSAVRLVERREQHR
ncbi:multicomponent Na+:H+ antiporter subunit F [Amycolatopsis arida]|uniref:Multicomponent Na+:H+ antiporter subunit F n=1 Tax=Amycolatopsis arida TaxID=587909 RepID=A0A1I6AWX3_9PSEU|nr:monovalent cation/H+ antiporter complex subunit F [Amycolatopsis arida]TDX85370.1 multicomponent Na+:H+ antiporter subunit F [Amycolatopsis arida]SFQ73184.1 multicomponent Na+:H+ antiporter subunit F [Amycolatopsis arida]